MLTKTKIALAAALFAGTASVAVAQDADPNLLNRYPSYNGIVAAAPQATFQTAAVKLERHRHFREAPVRLQQDRGFQDQGFSRNPTTQGAGHAPGAFYEQEQSGYPQSPPGGGY